MGSDSRISFASQLIPNIFMNIQTGHYFDTQEKTFLCPNNCGISTCGSASLSGKNITGYIYEYINTQVNGNTSIYDTANNLKKYIESVDSTSEVHFILAGYEIIEGQKVPNIYFVVTGPNGNISLQSSNSTGAKWDGEIETISRIIKNHFICCEPIEAPSLTFKSTDGEELNIGDSFILPKKKLYFFRKIKLHGI